MMLEDDEASGMPEPETAAGRTPQSRDEDVAILTHSDPPPAYRGVVAGWPDDWRERWGRRANELEESGLSWRDAESQAFVEVWNQVRDDL